jgi:IS605 OrfB family transposase
MKAVLQVKLLPTDAVYNSMIKTMELFNEACNYVSEEAFNKGVYSKFKLQKLVYYDVKDKYNLTAQMAILVIHKVSASYKLNKDVLSEFKKHGAITYDSKIMRFKGMGLVNLWTIDGRNDVDVVMGKYQKGRWFQVKGQADLLLTENKFYLLVTRDAPEDTPIDPIGYIGVDLGIKKIAVTSNGTEFCGELIENKRQKYYKLRRSLQKKGTKSAKRHLKKIKNKEAGFRKDFNHCVSKKIVEEAKGTFCGISLENLKNIRNKTTVRKSQRAKHSGWSFYQLQKFIEYKALINGVDVKYIDPAYTSRECFECGHIDKKNRRTQEKFLCVSCNHSDNADSNAAKNIRRRAEDLSSCSLSWQSMTRKDVARLVTSPLL